MARRVVQNKVIMYSVIAVLVAAIILIIVLRLK